MQRELYLVAYDIREPKRLYRMLYILKDYASGGQKSAFECYLSDTEKKELLNRCVDVMERAEDALLIMRLKDKDKIAIMGKAVRPIDETYTYIG
jgi:CRISPR-associated protein Cas2